MCVLGKCRNTSAYLILLSSATGLTRQKEKAADTKSESLSLVVPSTDLSLPVTSVLISAPLSCSLAALLIYQLTFIPHLCFQFNLQNLFHGHWSNSLQITLSVFYFTFIWYRSSISKRNKAVQHTHTHTHTHIYISQCETECKVTPSPSTYLKMKMKSMSSMQKVATLSIVFISTTSCLCRAGMKRTSFSTRISRKVLSTDRPPPCWPTISHTLAKGKTREAHSPIQVRSKAFKQPRALRSSSVTEHYCLLILNMKCFF